MRSWNYYAFFGFTFIWLLGFASAISSCADRQYEYGSAFAYSQVCFDFASYSYYTGDVAKFWCNSDSTLWIAFDPAVNAGQCGDNSCPGVQAENPYYLALTSDHYDVAVMCHNRNVAGNGDWARSSVGYNFHFTSKGLKPVEQPVVVQPSNPSTGVRDIQPAPDPTVVQTPVQPVSNPSFLAKFIDWLKSFFRSLGLGSLSSDQFIVTSSKSGG